MAYDIQELEKLSLEIIRSDEHVVFFQDIIPKLPCNSATFYNHELEKLETIKDALLKNRSSIKTQLRKKWQDGENATTQVALYKLISTDDEKQSLSNYDKVDHKHTLIVPPGEITFKIEDPKDASD
jgi:hypothetical protein